MSDDLLKNYTGGIKWTVAAIISGIATFIIGLVDGIVRPLKCN